MDPLALEGCFERGIPDLITLLDTVNDGAELAALAAAIPDTLALWRINSPDLELRFREAVRDRYRELTQAQLAPHPLM